MTARKQRYVGGKKGRRRVPPDLKAMRAIVGGEGVEQDDTPVRKKLRELFDGDFKAFMAMMDKAEARFAGKPGGKDDEAATDGRAEATIEDAGTERALELVETLLAERPWEQDEK